MRPHDGVIVAHGVRQVCKGRNSVRRCRFNQNTSAAPPPATRPWHYPESAIGLLSVRFPLSHMQNPRS